MKKHEVVIQNDQNIPAYDADQSAKKDHRKTSVGYTLVSILLYIVALVPLIAVPAVLAIRCYELVPYYSFWPFIGVIIGGVFALLFTVIALIVCRKNSKGSVRTQTVKLAITYVCLTGVFSLVLTYGAPDIIEYATQNTLFCEDMFYNAGSQAEINAALDRDFFMYNILTGNMNKYDEKGNIAENGDFSYTTLSKRTENENGKFLRYNNPQIQKSYLEYKNKYTGNDATEKLQKEAIDPMKTNNERKYELYDFIYQKYVLNDYDYAFDNSIDRRAFTLALIDYIYTNAEYEKVLKEGFANPRMKQLFVKNFENFKQDGYNAFDDPLLLYAQQSGRMTVPVIVRLILNEGWRYSQSSVASNGALSYNEEGNYLYQLYDPELRDQFVADGGKFEFKGEITGDDGNPIKDVKYGFNKDGIMIFENGVTKRPMNWLVLDMLGDPMALTTLDLGGISIPIKGTNVPLGELLPGIIKAVPKLVDSVGNFVQDELINEVIVEATNGAKLTLSFCFDDNGDLAINLFPMNHNYGMIGYMQASWVESNNLLFAVINVVGLRNWFSIFSAVGVVLVIAAGICRECGRKTRERTEDSRDRIERKKRKQKEQEAKEEGADGENLEPFTDLEQPTDRAPEQSASPDFEQSADPEPTDAPMEPTPTTI